MGGILTLQGSDGVNPTKLAYLLGVGACGALSLYSLRDPQNQVLKSFLSPLIPWFYIWTFVVAVSFLAAQDKNVSTSDWIRGAIPYALFAATPIVVFDAVKNSIGHRVHDIIKWLFVLAGLLCAISWAIAWTARRGYGSFGIERLFLWSFLLPAALFCYAISAAFHSTNRRTAWMMLALFTFGMFAITGTRSSLLFGVAPIVLILVNRHSSVRRGASFIIPVAIAALLLAGFFSVTADYINLDTTTVTDRFSGLLDFESVEAGDASYQERNVQTELAKMEFRQSPWIGVSPGFRYQWFLPTGEIKSSFNIDTAYALPANFGILGIAAALVTFGRLLPFMRTVESFGSDLARERDALKCFIAVSLASFWMGSPFEDKGFSFAFMFLLSLILIRLKALADPPGPSPSGGSKATIA